MVPASAFELLDALFTRLKATPPNTATLATAAQKAVIANETLDFEARLFPYLEEDLRNRERLRRTYGIGAALVAVLQLLVLDFAFFAAGCQTLSVSDSVFSVFITGTFVQVVSIVLLITGHIFSGTDAPIDRWRKILKSLHDK